MNSLCYQILHSHHKKFFILAIVMSIIMGGLFALLVRLAEVRSRQNDLSYSMNETAQQNDTKLYFPFGHNDPILWPKPLCPKGNFYCNSTNSCLDLSRKCDGVIDCPHAEDELNCVCAFRTPPEKFCDRYPDCKDQSDEQFCNYCSPESFNCGNGRCIPMHKVCDSVFDCSNAMDENFCFRLASDVGMSDADLGMTTAVAKSGFLLRNKNGIWYPICYSQYDLWLDTLASYACVSITANPLASSAHEHRSFQQTVEEFTTEFIYHIHGKFILWNGCIANEGIFVTCDDVLCGFNPNLLLPKSIHRTKRIVGGQSSQPGSWPWHAGIFKNGTYTCGATLINARWLLSASHCFVNFRNHYYEVQLGMVRRLSFSPHQKSYTIEYIVTHDRFNVVTLEFDIALLKTTERVSYDFWVRPVCLPDRQKIESFGTYCTAVGWGATGEKEEDSDHLREVRIPLTPDCRKSDRWICAGFPEGGYDACQGDSGGPLMCPKEDGFSFYVAGVISAGTGCARPDTPGMYTKVSYFLNWIDDIVSQNNFPATYSPLANCPGWRCHVVGGGSCLPSNKLCDGKVDCFDAQDEINCTSDGKKLPKPKRTL